MAVLRSIHPEFHLSRRRPIILYEVDEYRYDFTDGDYVKRPFKKPSKSLRRSVRREYRQEFEQVKPKLHALCSQCQTLRFSPKSSRNEEASSSVENLPSPQIHTRRQEDSDSFDNGDTSSDSRKSDENTWSEYQSIAGSGESAALDTTTEALLRSTKAGCHLCTLIVGALELTPLSQRCSATSVNPIILTIAKSRLNICYGNRSTWLPINNVPPDLSPASAHSKLFHPAIMHAIEIRKPIPDDCFTTMDPPGTTMALSGSPYKELMPRRHKKSVFISSSTWNKLSELIPPRLSIIFDYTEEGMIARQELGKEPSRRYMKMLPSRFDSYYLEPPHPYCSCGEGLWETSLQQDGGTAYTHRNPLGNGLIEQIKHWMATCDRLHPECEREGGRIHSLRLIDVGPLDGKQMPTLVEGLEDTRKFEYITLSYRWGDPSADMLTTTTKTINQRKAGIPMHLLPNTMRDAAIITRALGIRYLWIDALCILQDLNTDWEVQSANMAEIYSRSVISISTHAARTVHDGFLKPRNPLEIRGCIHPSLMPGRRVVISPRIPDPDREVADSILNQRGWTLQEQILPRRILHWGPQEVSWECRTMRATERRPLGKAVDPNRPEEEMRNNWVKLVENYSRRHLTVSSDKLPAIAGLASSFQRFFSPPPTYIAGIWYEAAVPYLGWHRHSWNNVRGDSVSDSSNDNNGVEHESLAKVKSHRVPSHPVRMPTFSWSSTDSPIAFSLHSPNPVDSLMAEALGYQIELHGKSALGAVKSASIKLHGYVKPLAWVTETTHLDVILDDPELERPPEDSLLLHLFCSIDQPAFRCSRGFSQQCVLQHALILLYEHSIGSETFRRVGLMTRSFSSGSGPGEEHQDVYPSIFAELESWTKKEVTVI
ncbi:HET-domain-containing protein [Lentithecium fluviatile CBS 122367]|uniref:HET-domain-containing protein n=1 Tax=Lentithecium fluviatile CBS 122367 TaxID=1168545 RepID=A0A6G1JEZ2_9PLEO|nr:HET-domain-containing protein [Lentithecium fluviatile CBS 122367]